MRVFELKLETGNACEVIRVRNGCIPNYYLLVFPKAQGEPSSEDVSEMLKTMTEKYHLSRNRIHNIVLRKYLPEVTIWS